jgi:pimeloyl-ACP methyl ester carboxylesterase
MPSVKTDTLEIHYLESGAQDGWPVILSHGFPYSAEAFTKVAPLLAAQGARVIIPYLRGYGKTRFLSGDEPHTGQQAALALDLIGLMDALGLDKAILAGFDWGGLASCAATALFPERVEGLVCYGGYDVYDPATSSKPANPALEKVMWYQHLFQSARGKDCLHSSRNDIARLLWAEWSPSYQTPSDAEAAFFRAFRNPDFVDVVISVYRHSMGNWPGEQKYADLERSLTSRPAIKVPAVTVDGSMDPLKPGGTETGTRDTFVGKHEHWTLPIGHAFPLEAPHDFAKAVLTVKAMSDSGTDWFGPEWRMECL